MKLRRFYFKRHFIFSLIRLNFGLFLRKIIDSIDLDTAEKVFLIL